MARNAQVRHTRRSRGRERVRNRPAARGPGQWGQNTPYLSPILGGQAPGAHSSPGGPGNISAPGQGPGGPGGGDAPGGPPDIFSAALERMRASSLQGYEANQRAYDEGLSSLKSRFFDPANQHSEASQIALADQISRKRALNAAAGSDQLFSGSMVNAENAITDDTGRRKHDMQTRFDDLARGLLEQKTSGDNDIRMRLEGAEFDYASMIAGDPSNTDVPAAAGKAGRVHPTKTKSHAAAGLKKVGANTYIGPNGTYWHRTRAGTFARGKR